MIEDILQQSRVSNLIGQIERGEQVDLRKIAALLTLDMVRLDESFAVEMLANERESDDRAVKLFE